MVRLRRVRPGDVAAIAAIYAYYVASTRISFESEPPTAQAMAERIGGGGDRFPWLVAERAGAVLGYAYAAPFRARPAYRFAVETSIYLSPGAQRQGVGRALYGRLLDILAAQHFVHAVGAVSLPNDASAALHRALGFAEVGSYPMVGYKHGEWASVGLFQKALAPLPAMPAEPLPLSQCPAWAAIAP